MTAKSTEERGTRRSIYAAFTANLLIAVSKFVAGLISGSAALLAESAHSIADTVNQVFLLVSLRSAGEAPDDEHVPAYRGHVLATEASRDFIDHAFSHACRAKRLNEGAGEGRNETCWNGV